jgi:hypothetical protein
MERSHGHKGPGQKVFAGVQRVAEDKPTRNIDDISLSLSLSLSLTLFLSLSFSLFPKRT